MTKLSFGFLSVFSQHTSTRAIKEISFRAVEWWVAINMHEAQDSRVILKYGFHQKSLALWKNCTRCVECFGPICMCSVEFPSLNKKVKFDRWLPDGKLSQDCRNFTKLKYHNFSSASHQVKLFNGGLNTSQSGGEAAVNIWINKHKFEMIHWHTDV